MPDFALLALSPDDQPMLLWYIVGGIVLVGNGLQGWVALLSYWQSKTVDSTQFITRAEFNHAKAERDKQLLESIGSIKHDFSQLSKVVNELSKDLPAIHRALGRLEGHDEAEAKQQPATPRRR